MTRKSHTTITGSGKQAVIRVIDTGSRYGHIGQVLLGGRVKAETRVVPYGMDHVALDLAEQLAATL